MLGAALHRRAQKTPALGSTRTLAQVRQHGTLQLIRLVAPLFLHQTLGQDNQAQRPECYFVSLRVGVGIGLCFAPRWVNPQIATLPSVPHPNHPPGTPHGLWGVRP